MHAARADTASGQFLAVAFPTVQVQILPYNRLARAAEGTPAAAILNAIAARFPLESSEGPVLPAVPGRVGLYCSGRWFTLELPATERPDGADAAAAAAAALDVAVLQEQVLAPILGIADPRTDSRIGFAGGVRPASMLEAAVDSGSWTVAFTMHATSVDQLLAVADADGIMPPKSTWFEPKLLDGLVSLVLD